MSEAKILDGKAIAGQIQREIAEQVAETMGKRTGAVKQLQRRGLIAVRRALAADVTSGEKEVTP